MPVFKISKFVDKWKCFSTQRLNCHFRYFHAPSRRIKSEVQQSAVSAKVAPANLIIEKYLG